MTEVHQILEISDLSNMFDIVLSEVQLSKRNKVHKSSKLANSV